jgi:hypothetical protein
MTIEDLAVGNGAARFRCGKKPRGAVARSGRDRTGRDLRQSLRREEVMLDGPMLLVAAVAVLAAFWLVVLYGSTYFGPR